MAALRSSTPWLVATALLAGRGVAFTTPARNPPPMQQRSAALAVASAASPAPAVLSSAPAATEYDVVKVDLADGRDYPIYIGSDFSDGEAASLLRPHVLGKRVLLITNDNIDGLYLDRYQRVLEGDGIRVDTVVLPDGEEHKTFECMSMILDKALELGLDRRSTFVALGGGVIGDMVGFASAIYQRGVNFIQVRGVCDFPANSLSTPVQRNLRCKLCF